MPPTAASLEFTLDYFYFKYLTGLCPLVHLFFIKLRTVFLILELKKLTSLIFIALFQCERI